MTHAEVHVLVRLIQGKTSWHIAGNKAIRAAIEVIQQRGNVITPPKSATKLRRKLQQTDATDGCIGAMVDRRKANIPYYLGNGAAAITVGTGGTKYSAALLTVGALASSAVAP